MLDQTWRECGMLDRRTRRKLFHYLLGVFIVISFVTYFLGVEDLENVKRNDDVVFVRSHIEPPWLVEIQNEFEEGEIDMDKTVNVKRKPDIGKYKSRENQNEEDERYRKPVKMLEFEFNQHIITLPNRTYNLPTNCPPHFKPNPDIFVLDTMRNCGPRDKKWITEFEMWSYTKLSECKGRFVGYNNEFIVLYDAIIDKSLGEGIPGGENALEVLNRRNEDIEYYKLAKGFFKIPWCASFPTYYWFRGEKNHLSNWIKAVKPINGAHKVSESRLGVTVAVTRYEYYNLYHTVSDLYNTFLVLTYLRKRPKDARIVLIEGHPKSNLDEFWKMFKTAERISSLPRVVHFNTMIWGIPGHSSPMESYNDEQIPLVEEFREYVLNEFSLTDKNTYNCKSLTVTIISRMNYIASPRNPTGLINRKISNEEELLMSLRQKFHGFDIALVNFETYSITAQLELSANTDILIGMHGAGLTHMMFMPKHSGVIELFPHKKTWSGRYDKYRRIGHWRKLNYMRWRNDELKNEIDKESTRIPPKMLNNLVLLMYNQLCHKNSTKKHSNA